MRNEGFDAGDKARPYMMCAPYHVTTNDDETEYTGIQEWELAAEEKEFT